MSDQWERFERDEDIVGWKIELSGWRGAFYVEDKHLQQLGLSLGEYIIWLRMMRPHREVKLDS